MIRKRDPLEQYLIDLDGQYFQYEGGYYAKLMFRVVANNRQIPHGFRYALTFHRKDGERLLGFDNSHAVPERSGPAAKSRRLREFDHQHKGDRTYPYQYIDLAKLLSDFWDAVDTALEKERRS